MNPAIRFFASALGVSKTWVARNTSIALLAVGAVACGAGGVDPTERTGETSQELLGVGATSGSGAVFSDGTNGSEGFCLNQLYRSDGSYNTSRSSYCKLSGRTRASEWTGGYAPACAFQDAWGGCGTTVTDTWSKRRGFSGSYYYGVKGVNHLLTVSPLTDPPVYPMTYALGQDITRYMHNLAMDYGANDNDIWYHAMGAAAGGYYRWYRRSAGAQYAPYDLLVYWNAADDAAYMVNQDPWWQGAAANIYAKYAALGYERSSALRMPTSNNLGDAWGISWQRFVNGYIVNRSNGYNDMVNRARYVGGLPGTPERHVAARYGALFDFPNGPANRWSLDFDVSDAYDCRAGSCRARGKYVRAWDASSSTFTWVTAMTGADRAYAVQGAIANAWQTSEGGASYSPWESRLGFPTGEYIPNGDGGTQFFEGGKIMASSSSAWVVLFCDSVCTSSSSCSAQNYCNTRSGQTSTCVDYGSCNLAAECSTICASGTAQCDTPCNYLGTPKTCAGMSFNCQGPVNGKPQCNTCGFASDCGTTCATQVAYGGTWIESSCKNFKCNRCADSSNCGPNKQECGGSCTDQAGATTTCASYGATIDDRDRDGIPDSLELALAKKFFPDLNQRHKPMGSALANDVDQFYGNTWAQLFVTSGANVKLPFAVNKYGPSTLCPDDFQCLEIRYALLYNHDLGDPTFGEGHRGDNEGYSVLAMRKKPGAFDTAWSTAKSDVNAWRAVGRFFGAHTCAVGPAELLWVLPPWPGASIIDTTNWDYSQIAWSANGRTTPDIVYAVEGKHGSFYSVGQCDHGSFGADSCAGGSDVRLRSSQSFIGSKSYRAYHLDALGNSGSKACHEGMLTSVQAPSVGPSVITYGPEQYAIWTGTNFAGYPATGAAVETVDFMIDKGIINWDMSKILCPNSIGPTLWKTFND